jgi:hypothetical protein
METNKSDLEVLPTGTEEAMGGIRTVEGKLQGERFIIKEISPYLITFLSNLAICTTLSLASLERQTKKEKSLEISL